MSSDSDLNPQVVASVREATDVVEVVGEHVRLRRRGRKFEGLCPFHEEKTPSFSVDPEKGLYYCFGCQQGGDIISFVMQLENLSFPEAVERLARRYGVRLPLRSPESRQRQAERDRIRTLLEESQSWFVEQLGTRAGAAARRSLEERDFPSDSWQGFGFGYAPDDWRQLLEHLTARHTAGAVVAAGLAIRPEGGKAPYDRFRNRITFPIRAGDGSLVAFGGRAIGDGEPKYLNSPEGPLFHKRSTLFMLERARRAMASDGDAMVVEGYFDCLSLHRVGLDNAVATLGTALTSEHARILRRLASRVLLCYDADDAGRRAAFRGAQALLEAGLDVAAIVLSPGQDPDDLVREGGVEAFRELLSAPTPLLDFLVDGLPEDRDKRRQAGVPLAELVGSARDPVMRFTLLDALAQKLDLRFDVLEEWTRHTRRPGQHREPSPTRTATPTGELLLARILVEGGASWRQRIVADVDPSQRRDPRVRRLLERAQEFDSGEPGEQRSFDQWLCEHGQDEELKNLVAEIGTTESPPLTDEMIRRQLTLLLRQQWKNQASRLGPAIKTAEETGDLERVQELQEQQQALRTRKPRF